MAKPKLPNQRDAMRNLKKRIEKYMLLVQDVYDTYNLEASKMALSAGYEGEKPFRFADYPTTRYQIKKLLTGWGSDMSVVIHRTTSEEWKQSNLLQDLLADKVMAYYFGTTHGKRMRKYYQVNSDALKAFQERRDYGMNLSQRIWNQSRLYQKGLEDAISVGIQKGMSAVTLSKRVSKYLKDFPKLQKDYKAKYGKATDGVNCEYRSMRLARNEINLAYRTAEQKRWQQMDFIIGKEIKTSSVHDDHMPDGDMCDLLAGKYPKDFLWTGWHVNCMCYEVPIIKKDYDFFAPDDEPAENEVTDVPENYKAWIRDNAERIEKAEERGTLPYFLKENPDYKKILSGEEELSTLEKAKLRHEARTPEEVEAIKKAWAEREHKHELIKKTAINIYKVSNDYGEVDSSELQDAILSGNLDKMQSITKDVAHELSKIKKQEQALSDLIPDVHEWHKTATLAELQGVHDAVEAKIASLSGLSLEQQAKKLKFEAIDFLGGNMKDVQSKYPNTWKVSQAAYLKKLGEVEYKIEIKNVQSQLNIIDDYLLTHPQSKKVDAKLADAYEAIAMGEDISVIKQKTELAVKEYNKRLAEQARYAKKKGKGTSFDADSYTKERKDAAMWAQDTKDADDKLRGRCGSIWRTAPDSEKDAIHGYTSSYHNINEPLRGLTYYGSDSQKKLGEARIPEITKIIDKSSYDFDMWLQRGDDLVSLKKFGLSDYDNASEADVQALVGKEGIEGAFWSAGVAKGTGFNGKPVIFNIYAPKGTKAMYCEPFSAFGNGFGREWDGVSEQSSFGTESEILIQRGTKCRITKVQRKYGTWYIDVDIIEQKPLPFPYSGGYPYL